MSVRGAIAPALILGLVIWAGTRDLRTPATKPATAPADQFSAERAFEHVKRIAARPHPVGTAAHDEARDEVVRAFRELGLEVETQRGMEFEEGRESVHGAIVENVIALLPGAEPAPGATRETQTALGLVAHYDSVPTGPGAGDDAAGVAALIETARALLAGPRPLHPIRFIVTDGEEAGLLGARLYCRESTPNDAPFVVNFEGRGNRGPSILFQLALPPDRFFDAARRLEDPVATSLANAVYRRMPNDTDLSVFQRSRSGANFAFIGGLGHYHTMCDDPARLDLGSLQHHGDNALTLARALANQSPSAAATDDELRPGGFFGELNWFSLGRFWFILLSSDAVELSGVLALAISYLAVVLALRRRRVRARDSALHVLGVAILCIVPAGILAATSGARAGGVTIRSAFPVAVLHAGGLLDAGLLLVAAAIALVPSTLLRHARPENGPAFLGAALATGMVCLGLTWDGAYLPIMLSLAAGLMMLPSASRLIGLLGHLVAAVSALLVVGVLAPLIGFLVQALPGAGHLLCIALFGIAFPLLAPLLHPIVRAFGWRLPILIGVAGALVLGRAALLESGPGRPRITERRLVGPGTARHPAPQVVRLLEHGGIAGTVRVRVVPPEGARVVRVRIAEERGTIVACDEYSFEKPPGFKSPAFGTVRSLTLAAPPTEGFELQIRTEDVPWIDLEASAVFPLPFDDDSVLPARAPDTMPPPNVEDAMIAVATTRVATQ